MFTIKQLLILSGKGGTGKTTTAAAFISFSKSRAIADCDVDAPNLHIVRKMNVKPERSHFIGSKKARIDTEKCSSCGICRDFCRFGSIKKSEGKFRISEYSCEGCGVCAHLCPQNAIIMEDDIAGEQKLYLQPDSVFSTAKLKMGRGNSGKLVTNVKKAMLKNSPENEEIAIVDGSPGIGCPVIASVSGIDLVLIVAEPSMSGISDLERLIKTADTFEAGLAVCVNKWDASPESTEKIIKFCEEKDLCFVGKIPYDKSASKAINEGVSIAEIDCPARDALFEVYKNTMKILK